MLAISQSHGISRASIRVEEAAVRRFIASLIVAPLLVGTVPAFAQSSPSADQIINSLKPSGNLLSGGTRGIRLAPPSDSTSPVQPVATGQARYAAAKPMAAPAAPSDSPSVSLTVDFATGSADLTPQARATLDQLGRALSSSELANFRFRIEGHTDTVGSADYNRSLSERRADAVVSYLESKFGVQAARLQAIGMGEQGLLVSTPPQTPEPRNRRVQVINLGA